MSSSLQVLSSMQVNLLQTFSFPILVLLFFTLLLIKWLFFSNPKTLKNLPPSPPKLPIIGNLHQLGTLPHRSLQKLSRRYGPIMSLSLGRLPAVVITSADAAREIMRTHDIIFANRPETEIFRKLFYNMQSISTAPYDEYWRRLKGISTLQLLNKKRILSFRPVREEETAILMNMIKNESCSFSEPVNLSDMFTWLISSVICRTALGRKYNDGGNGKKIRELLIDFFGLFGSGGVEDCLPWLTWINRVNGKNATMDRVARDFDEFLEEVVQERFERVETQSNGENHDKVNEEIGKNFVDILIGIHKDKDAPISLGRDGIKAIILDMFAGGTDTSSTAIEWAMTELLRNPRIMMKLQDEVRGIAKGKENVNEDDLERMHYLKALMKETLRCYPPAPTIVPRKSSQDVQIMGYDIPMGSMIIINAWAMARDPTMWEDPEEFKPERFLNSSIDFKGQYFEYIPFGSGRRGCPGMSFAMATIELALANIVHKFDWKLPNGAQGKDLDMTECAGGTIHRKVPLLAIPTPSTSSF